MRFKIKDSQGNVVRVIKATREFVENNYPGLYEEEAEQVVGSGTIPRAEFIARFTNAELGKIQTLALTNETASGFVFRVKTSETINLADPKITGPIYAGVPALWTAARALELLGI